jgi:hypothetical protein
MSAPQRYARPTRTCPETNEKASRLYYWLLNRGIVVRWAMYIIPILALLWIPGILGVTATRNAKVWDVKLVSHLSARFTIDAD